MKLTEHFDLDKLTITNTGLPNTPDANQIERLKQLAIHVLEPSYKATGPFIVTSGYRSEKVNARVKGAINSQHCRGNAADLKCGNNEKLFNFIRKNLEFDQLIWEAGDNHQPAWVHVSYVQGSNRKQVLRMKNGRYSQYVD